MAEEEKGLEQGFEGEEREELKAYLKLESANVGEVVKISDKHAETILTTDEGMTVDDLGMINPGSLFSAAMFCAIAAINNPFAVVVSAESKFLAPIEKGSEIHFFAKVMQDDAKKREVKVTGTLLGLKVFEGVFDIAVFEKHILKMKISNKI